MCGDFEASYDLTNQGHGIPLTDRWYRMYQGDAAKTSDPQKHGFRSPTRFAHFR
jgi:hypothetical protein